MISRVEDHVEQGVAHLATQYRNMRRIRGLLKSWLYRIQELEDAIWSVIVDRILPNAVGAQLDVIGKIVGESRKGREDAVYLIYILARIRINRSHGTAEDVLAVLEIVEPNTRAEIRDRPPACLQVELHAVPVASPVAVALADVSGQAKAGGVRFGLVSPTVPRHLSFAFGSVHLPDQPLRGCGHVGDDTIGGRLSAVYEVPPL